MKIFLTGATGYLGSAIAAELVRAGHDVTALVRSKASRERVAAEGMRAHRGDLREPSSYRDAALAADAIVHAAIESGSDRLDVDRIFAEAAAGPSLVYTSVMFVLGDVDGGDEQSSAAGPRAEHEQIVLRAGGAVVRPGMIWGGDAWLFSHPIVIGEGTNRWPLVHCQDAATLYRLIVENRARGTFHASAEVLRARDVFDVPGTSLDEARTMLGPFADALALDQNVSSRRSESLGWKPARSWVR